MKFVINVNAFYIECYYVYISYYGTQDVYTLSVLDSWIIFSYFIYIYIEKKKKKNQQILIYNIHIATENIIICARTHPNIIHPINPHFRKQHTIIIYICFALQLKIKFFE